MSSLWGKDDAQAFADAWNGDASARDADIAELVRTAQLVSSSADARMRPEFRLELRGQLMREAATSLVSTTTARPAAPVRQRSVRRRLVALVAVLVATLGAVGMVASSASALPGDMLYPLKRGVESVELALHRDDAARGDFRLSQATERLAEASALASDDSARSQELVVKALDDFSEQAEAGSRALFSDFSSRGDTSSIGVVNEFTSTSSARLATLSDVLPDLADDAFRAAADTVSNLALEASSLCDSCAAIDLSNLVAAVETLTDLPRSSTDPERADDEDTKGTETAAGEERSPAVVPAPAASTTTPPPAPSGGGAPSPTPTTTPTPTPPLKGLTDPLIGGLLGDDDQVGLVPGLIGGLLDGLTGRSG